MFSKLLTRSAFSPFVRANQKCQALVALRHNSAVAAPGDATPAAVPAEGEAMDAVTAAKFLTESMSKKIQIWEEAHKMYNSPERDYVNFPVVPMRTDAVGFRLFIFNEPWFDAFYKTTGVTGPYVLIAGTFVYLTSKEWLPWMIGTWFGISGGIIWYWLYFNCLPRKGGQPWGLAHSVRPALKAKFPSLYTDSLFAQQRAADVNDKQDLLSKIDGMIEVEGGRKYAIEVYRENVELQLEAQYRKRLVDVHTAVKKRLDYQVATDLAKRQFEQRHMVSYIVDSVRASVTPTQEKEMLTKCFADLKTLAASQKA